MKQCNKCNLLINIDDFYKGRNSCKECSKKYTREYIKSNKDMVLHKRISSKDKRKIYNANYSKNNKEQLSIKNATYYKINKNRIKSLSSRYRLNNKEKIYKNALLYEKERMSSDISFRLKRRLRTRLKNAIRDNLKSGSAVSDLGCSIAKLKIHLQLKFHRSTRGRHEYMSWYNYGHKGWHIDHIKPLSSFDLTKREEFLKACHYTNLQPLWAKDNLKKSDKY